VSGLQCAVYSKFIQSFQAKQGVPFIYTIFVVFIYLVMALFVLMKLAAILSKAIEKNAQ
jgi:hypothetical protein